MKTSSSTLKEFHTIPPPKGALYATGRSLAISPKTSFSVERKKTLDKKKQGLTEALKNSCDLHLCLISEGAECIFIPQIPSLAEASTEFRKTALALACAYPQRRGY
ncbi:unnamed protein product [Rangifer tarandus platyrhynchus]|uniref:Uncharacterized protein n=1 Tax=Rangifer tarandus platyrhynchus TaxID=3082113 RepID=A0ABN8ZET6_RANTA|nr:unnamed protein product [Rangifer tarandus platyrhynchus]